MSKDAREAIFGMPLTARQLQVATMLGDGKTNHEVAAALETSVKTVDSHRQAVMKKLGLRNNAELAHHAIRVGWIELRKG